ncbi:MAG: ABC transporter substrate-binding protein [Candidatus Methanoperedenaceae archaeon]|nr:ABC transporter substrate-binding protein [Candidatus Methanoperedenaceae archaeon]
MNEKVILVFLGVILLTTISGCITTESPTKDIKTFEIPTKTYEGKKILYIDSYNAGYEWSDGVTKGIENILNDTGVELKILRMDTKRDNSRAFAEKAGLEARSVIEEFQPDIVIASDDNAFNYVIMPYYRDADLPVVFCGINWDVSLYGGPYKNTAGMIEISLTSQLISYLKEYSKGNRIGYLSADTETERKNALYYNKLFNINFTKIYFVKTQEEWKEAFLKLQDEVDIFIFENNAGINNWNDSDAEAFALNNTKIPVGTTNSWTMQSSFIGMTKVAEEQGEWSALTALRILNGTRPSDIPIVTNDKGMLYVNLKIAQKLGAIVKPELLKNARIIR